MPNTLHFPSEKLIAAKVPLAPVPGRPDLIAHQARDVFDFWQAWEEESGAVRDVPYWATIWPAARLLAAFFLDHGELVADKSVLDFGCGGGLAGLAARKAGARSLIANDIDPTALMMTKRNADANGLALEVEARDLLRLPPDPAFEVILVGDMFYDRSVSEATLAWLTKARRLGSRVLIADGSRPFSPREDVEVLHEEEYATDKDLEGRSERRVRLLAFQP